MLTHLFIQNYALIEQLELDFHSGLNIITGETGAGKSILLGALGLIQGRRADTSSIMQGKDKCVVEAHFAIGTYSLQPLFEEEDIDYADDIIIRRQVNSAGKSRAFVNDLPVSLSQLRTLTERILDIHSQHANLLLQNAPFQLAVLDAFAHTEMELQAYRPLYAEWQQQCRRIDELEKARAKALEEQDYLRFQQEELHSAGLKAGEQEQLELRQRELSNAETLGSALTIAAQALNGDSEYTALAALRTAQSALKQVGAVMPETGELAERLESLCIDLVDAANEAESLLDRVQAEPQELAQIQERLGMIYHLQTKHRCATVDELLALQERIDLSLDSLDSGEHHLAVLRKEEEGLRLRLSELADKLHCKRADAQDKIAQKATETLVRLGMEHALFVAEISLEESLLPTGRDSVQFLFSANRQQGPQPLAKVASGGEMSRVMLSLKQIMAQSQSLPTIIFDEIDTGISGQVATQMGQILAGMGAGMQVVNITHLPQIAAQGTHHFLVYKEHGDEQTRSRIRLLSPEERVQEIAKMLSGDSVSDAARQNARELLRGEASR